MSSPNAFARVTRHERLAASGASARARFRADRPTVRAIAVALATWRFATGTAVGRLASVAIIADSARKRDIDHGGEHLYAAPPLFVADAAGNGFIRINLTGVADDNRDNLLHAIVGIYLALLKEVAPSAHEVVDDEPQRVTIAFDHRDDYARAIVLPAVHKLIDLVLIAAVPPAVLQHQLRVAFCRYHACGASTAGGRPASLPPAIAAAPIDWTWINVETTLPCIQLYYADSAANTVAGWF